MPSSFLHIRLFVQVVVLYLLLPALLRGQPSNLGIPPVSNYDKRTIGAGTQTWDIEEDAYGYTWFANNQGVLRFDGYRWTMYPLANKTIVRSLSCDNQTHKVYVGGQGEFGYLSPDARGVFSYTSLSASLPQQHQNFGEVWHTIATAQGVFFRTDHQVFRYHNQQLTPLFPEGKSFNFLAVWGHKVTLLDHNNYIYEFDGRRFVIRAQNNHFPHGRISGIIPYGDSSLLVATLHDGIFEETATGFVPWKTNDDDYITSRVVYCAGKMADNRIILGTSYDGLLIIDKDRKIETHLNKNSGLQNNTVLSVEGCRSGNIWLGLDNGIDLVQLTSAFRDFFPDGDLQGAGYSIALHNQRLYLGANTGLYALPWKSYYTPAEKTAFQPVAGTRGQVWNLQEIEGQLFMGHHEGGFLVEGLSARKITQNSGVWKFVPLPDGRLLAGHYEGLIALEKSGDSWVQTGAMTGFKESSRIMEMDRNHNLWIAHPYRGIFRLSARELSVLQVSSNALFAPAEQEASRLLNSIYKVGDEIVVNNADQFYVINPDDQKLRPFTLLKEFISAPGTLKFMTEDSYKNIWYATAGEMGLLMPKRSFEINYGKHIINALNGRLIEGFQSAFTIDKYNVIFPTDRGFVLFNPSAYMHDTFPPDLFLAEVVLTGQKDSILIGGAVHNRQKLEEAHYLELPHDQNNLVIRYAVRHSSAAEGITFSYRIGDEGAVWSEWSPIPQISLSQLSPGTHLVQIKAKRQNGTESRIVQLRIRILPPWYLHPVALGLYLLLVVFAVWWRISGLKKRHHLEKKDIIADSLEKEKGYLLNAEVSREEINRLKHEKLEVELNFKNQELISFTYHLVNKNELITKIKRALNKLEPKFEHDKELKKEYTHIISLIEQNVNIDEDWENFMQSFDQVHSDFFKRLTSQFHHLSPNDYKMCIYLRMNLTSKEIAALMNISIRSVETNRYRLRKKLGLSSDENLTQFLLTY